VPPGTARYWSWLFAAPAAREPLLAMYALMAEWRALLDPATEGSVARIKLAWWHDEIRRLVAGAPLHPVTRHIAAMPHAAGADLAMLERTVAAAAAQLAGVPLERAAELEAHAEALYGVPLLAASQLAEPPASLDSRRTCIAALAAGEYLSRAVADYRREVHAGRMPFPVDELLAAGIENDDLAATRAPPRLVAHLDRLRQQAADHFSSASRTLVAMTGPDRRHLAVLATLGANQVRTRRNPADADFALTDLYNAWSAARRAAPAR
jgi:phytoene synthase